MALNHPTSPRKNILNKHRKPKRCMYCVRQAKFVDYKDLNRLSRHLSNFSRILPRRYTGTCLHHQKMVANAIKRAREMALMPYTMEHRQLERA